MSLQVHANPAWRADRRWEAAGAPLTRATCARAVAEIASWPGYAPSPLHELRGLARTLGVAAISYLDEGGRFGVGSFKALGAPYALTRMLAARLSRRRGARVTTRALMTGLHWQECRDVTAAAATDGNHGRALAWAARATGCRCAIYAPRAVSAGRRAAIESFGARLEIVDGTYDDAVARCAEDCARHGWLEVTDTAASSRPGTPGLSAARSVMAGYAVLVDEALARMAQPPTHLFAQAGVGGFAAGAAARLWQHLGCSRVRVVVAEPHRAGCLYASAVAGRMRPAEGDLATLMQGLACGVVSAPAWDVLSLAASLFVTIGDEAAVEAMRLLARGSDGDPALVAGESGCAGVAALCAVSGDAAARRVAALDADSRVLVVGTEGATDPLRYAALVGHPSPQVA